MHSGGRRPSLSELPLASMPPGAAVIVQARGQAPEAFVGAPPASGEGGQVSEGSRWSKGGVEAEGLSCPAQALDPALKCQLARGVQMQVSQGSRGR